MQCENQSARRLTHAFRRHGNTLENHVLECAIFFSLSPASISDVELASGCTLYSGKPGPDL